MVIFPSRNGRLGRTIADHTWGPRAAPPVHGRWTVRGLGYQWMARGLRGDRRSADDQTNTSGAVGEVTYLVFDKGGEWKIVEEIGEEPPDIRIAIFS